MTPIKMAPWSSAVRRFARRRIACQTCLESGGDIDHGHLVLQCGRPDLGVVRVGDFRLIATLAMVERLLVMTAKGRTGSS